jgi:hypothetical protein
VAIELDQGAERVRGLGRDRDHRGPIVAGPALLERRDPGRRAA